LHLVGDVNATTTIEIVGGAPTELEELTFNGEALEFKQNSLGIVTASVDFSEPEFSLPCFSDLEWKTLDSLPELSPDYDDGAWVDADLEESPNDRHPISTPVSLYAGDYGFNTGSVVFRGHFTANGEESTVRIVAQGGNAFGFSAWVGSTFLGSSLGAAAETNGTINVNLPSDLEAGSDHVLTVVMDHMGLHGNYVVGEDTIKAPRGILQFELAGHDASDVTWKITGNLGGEDYRDIVRGPLNEGGMYVERQGFHQPSPPSDEWEIGKPTQGLSAPGIAFYSTSFDLDIPEGYDIPLAFKLSNETATVGAYRVQLYVNGYQFGKFVPHIGPQSVFPVPEGILNHHGTNWLGITLWAMEEGGAKVNLGWDVAMVTETGYGEVELSEAPHWEEREGAY
jgi:hypothetical protein